MKRITAIAVLLAILLTGVNTFAEETVVDVFVNGKRLETDQPATEVDGRTYVPLRAISEALNWKVDWIEEKHAVKIQNEATVINIATESGILLKEDLENNILQQISLDAVPFEYNGRILVPVRAIAEAFFAKVDWNEEALRVDITMEYDYITTIYNGLSKVKKGDKFGFINEKRELIIPLIYEEASGVSTEGYITVKKDGGYGVIDSNGKMVIPFEYDKIGMVSGGYASVSIDGKWGFCDLNGKLKLKPEYDMLWSFSEGYAVVGKDGKWGHVNTEGEVVVPIIYRSADNFCEGRARVERDGKWGFVDTDGKEVIPPEYDRVSSFADLKAKVEKDGREFYINKDGLKLSSTETKM